LRPLTLRQFDEEKERILSLMMADATPFQDDSPAAKEERKRKTRNSVLEFAKVYLPHYVPGEYSEYHHDLEDYTNVVGEPVFGAGPKETGKSVLLTIADCLRCCCHGLRWFMIISSQTEDQAANRAAYIQFELENNLRIKQDFGEMRGDWLWEAKDFCCKNGRRVKSRAVKQGMAGLLHRHHRPDWWRGEDMEDEMSAKNKARTEDTKTVVLDVVLGGLADNFSMIWFGNIVAKKCALKQLIDEKDDAGKKKYKGKIYKLLQDDGTSLVPDIWPLPRIEKRRYQLGSVRFKKVYQNDPGDPNSRFREEWIVNLSAKTARKIQGEYFIVCYDDPIVEDTPTSCDAAVVVVGINLNKWEKDHVTDVIVFDAMIDKLSSTEVVNAHYLFDKKWHPVITHYFESVAFSKWIQRDFDGAVKQFGHSLSTRPYQQLRVNKMIRIETLSGPIERGEIKFVRSNGHVNKLIDQLCDPAEPKDGPDALASAFEILTRGERGMMHSVYSKED
jgi:hypothetical protein